MGSNAEKSGSVISLASEKDCLELPRVEICAGAVFTSIGMDEIAQDDPPSVELLLEYQKAGRLFIASDPREKTVQAYIVLTILSPPEGNDPGLGFVHQVSVSPTYARRGIGARLIAQAEAWSLSQKVPCICLTTFDNVPWNRPYYERLGFRVLSDTELQEHRYAELKRQLQAEREHYILKKWPRVAMMKPLV